MTAWVWGDTVSTGRCRSPRCEAAITWAENVRTGRRLAFTGELVALRTDRDAATGRPVWEVDLGDAHFATCPDAADFRWGRTGASRR